MSDRYIHALATNTIVALKMYSALRDALGKITRCVSLGALDFFPKRCKSKYQSEFDPKTKEEASMAL
jgi:hypothetical protein